MIEKIVEVDVRRCEISQTGEGTFEKFREIRLNEDGFEDLEEKWWTVTDIDTYQKRILNAIGLDEKIFKIKPRLL